MYEPEPEYEPVNDYADEHAGDSGAALMKVSPIATPPGVPGAQVLHSRNTRTTDFSREDPPRARGGNRMGSTLLPTGAGTSPGYVDGLVHGLVLGLGLVHGLVDH